VGDTVVSGISKSQALCTVYKSVIFLGNAAQQYVVTTHLPGSDIPDRK